jgi:hypothetical protein
MKSMVRPALSTAAAGPSPAPPAPWTTLHLVQPTRNPLINRGKLFQKPGPLLFS